MFSDSHLLVIMHVRVGNIRYETTPYIYPVIIIIKQGFCRNEFKVHFARAMALRTVQAGRRVTTTLRGITAHHLV